MWKSIITVLGALVLDLALGDPPNTLHPVCLMGGFIKKHWRRWISQSPGRQLIYGTALVLTGIMLFSTPWALLDALHLPFWWLYSIPSLKFTFAIRSLFLAGRQVQQALRNGNLSEARQLAGWHLVGRDTSQLSPSLVASATVESLAENITDSLTSPLFFFALGGLPGAWAYRFCNTCDSLLGYRDAEREYIGKFSAQLDDILNWVPARLTGVLIVLAARLIREDSIKAWRIMLSQHSRTSSPTAGWTMSAMAGALGVTLEKPGHYRLEGGSSLPDADTIERCFRLVRWTMVLVIGCIIAIMGVLHACFT